MAKKIVAFTFGKRYGNTEVYIKQALMAAEQMGCEVELIRMLEVELHTCVSCVRAPCFQQGPAGCIFKDDAQWLAEKYISADGIIVGAPVWSLTPPGMATVFRERVSARTMDAAGVEMMGGAAEWAKNGFNKPAALISVGGARSDHWTSLCLPTLYTTMFSSQNNVIDHINVTEVADSGAACLREDYLDRATELGQNVAHAALHPEKDWESKWLGRPEPAATCPGCHLNLMIVKPNQKYVECAICGRKGYPTMVDGCIKIDFPPDDPDDRLTMKGKFTHIREIMGVSKYVYNPRAAEAKEKLQKYKDYDDCVQLPPSKQK